MVQVSNNSGVKMYFAAGTHAQHDASSVLDYGVIMPGDSAQFTAPAAGSYVFHDHLKMENTTELIVH